MNNILIITKPNPNQQVQNFAKNLENWLHRRKYKIYFKETSKKSTEKNLNKNFHTKVKLLKSTEELMEFDSEIMKRIDLIITLGGDGTLIGLCRTLKTQKIPIVGVNLGGLGFIANFTKHDFFDHLSNILNSKFTMSNVSIFSAEVISKDNNLKKKFFFINDIVLSKNDISRIFPIELLVNDCHVYNLSGDGLIVSSPIGSTAYSLAAGGPIISPYVEAMSITPICPHSLSHRPVVVKDSCTIQLYISNKSSHIILTLDGQETVELHAKDKILIKKCLRKKCHLVDNDNYSYFEKLKEKFTLGLK